MKKILISLTVLFSTITMLSAQYLQDGVFPDCSYVVVTEDGWKVHKNISGRVLTMNAPGTHDTEPGRYSFDRFVSLVPFVECETASNASSDDAAAADVSIDFDFGKFLDMVIRGKTFLYC